MQATRPEGFLNIAISSKLKGGGGGGYFFCWARCEAEDKKKTQPYPIQRVVTNRKYTGPMNEDVGTIKITLLYGVLL